MATEKKQSFFGGAAVLAAGVVIVKIIGALFKIPLANILSETGNADFNNAYNIYIMEELHSILSLGAGGSTKMVGGGQIRRAFNAKYPREYIDRPEKRRANLMDFARFYAEQGE